MIHKWKVSIYTKTESLPRVFHVHKLQELDEMYLGDVSKIVVRNNFEGLPALQSDPNGDRMMVHDQFN